MTFHNTLSTVRHATSMITICSGMQLKMRGPAGPARCRNRNFDEILRELFQPTEVNPGDSLFESIFWLFRGFWADFSRQDRSHTQLRLLLQLYRRLRVLMCSRGFRNTMKPKTCSTTSKSRMSSCRDPRPLQYPQVNHSRSDFYALSTIFRDIVFQLE